MRFGCRLLAMIWGTWVACKFGSRYPRKVSEIRPAVNVLKSYEDNILKKLRDYSQNTYSTSNGREIIHFINFVKIHTIYHYKSPQHLS